MEITDLQIIPCQNHPLCRAVCKATLDHALTIDAICIMEGKNGITVKFPQSIAFTDADKQKDMSNRILATFVINHCVDNQ